MRSLANIVCIFAVFTLALPGLEGSLHGKEANWADTKESVATFNPCPISSPEGTNSIAGGTAPGRDRIDDQPCKGCIYSGYATLAGLIERLLASGGGAPGY